jgi:hypothetical protein
MDPDAPYGCVVMKRRLPTGFHVHGSNPGPGSCHKPDLQPLLTATDYAIATGLLLGFRQSAEEANRLTAPHETPHEPH